VRGYWSPFDIDGFEMNLVTAIHPKVIDALNATITEAKARGLTVGIHSGLRTGEDQDKLYSLGRTVINPDGQSKDKPLGNVITNAKAYESWHCLGLAGDIVFKDSKGDWTWNVKQDKWDGLGTVGEIFGLEWGGQWSKFPDNPHFQMRGKILNIREGKKILMEEGLEKLWSLV